MESLNPSRAVLASSMALEDYLAGQGRAGGIRVQFFLYTDAESDAMRRLSGQLATRKDIFALVGDIGSGSTELLAQVATEHQIPHLSFFAIDESIFGRNPWSFSYRPSVRQEIQLTGDFLLHTLQAESIAVVVTNNQTVSNRWDLLKAELARTSVNIGSVASADRAQTDFTAILKALEQATAMDALVLFLLSSQLEPFLQQLRGSKLSCPVVVSTVSMPFDGVAELPDLPVPIFTLVQQPLLSLQDGTDEDLADFARRYRIAMGTHSLDLLGLWVYDGISLLCSALAESGSRQELFDSLSGDNRQSRFALVSFNRERLLEGAIFVPVLVKDGGLLRVATDE